MIETGNKGNSNKFCITPGKIALNIPVPANNPTATDTTANTQPAVQPDGTDRESKDYPYPQNKQKLDYEANIRASANELVLSPVMPF